MRLQTSLRRNSSSKNGLNVYFKNLQSLFKPFNGTGEAVYKDA